MERRITPHRSPPGGIPATRPFVSRPVGGHLKGFMGETHHVYLVPGFFGFANLGDLAYFHHVRDYLQVAFTEAGIDARIHPVRTSPTASLPRRAARLLETIVETAGGDEGPIHLIGHSSGGLDARLLVTPEVSLPTSIPVEPWASRVRSVVGVSTPHRGTPAAAVFTSVLGQKLLETMSLGTMYVLRFGRLPTAALLKLGALFARLDEHLGLDHNVLDQLFGQLLADFTPDRRDAILHFFDEVRGDQTLLPQITPAGMDLFNASTQDRPGVGYASTLSIGRTPGMGAAVAAGLDPYAHGTLAFYSLMYRLSARMPSVELPPEQRDAVIRLCGELPPPSANDGMVPTLSQVWGEPIHAALADHLDVIGHYGDTAAVPPHFDWLSTGAGFNRGRFVALWGDVVRWIVARHEGGR